MKTIHHAFYLQLPGPWVTISLHGQAYRARYEERPPLDEEDFFRCTLVLQRRSTWLWRLLGQSPWLYATCEVLEYIPAITRPSSERVHRLARMFEQENKKK